MRIQNGVRWDEVRSVLMNGKMKKRIRKTRSFRDNTREGIDSHNGKQPLLILSSHHRSSPPFIFYFCILSHVMFMLTKIPSDISCPIFLSQHYVFFRPPSLSLSTSPPLSISSSRFTFIYSSSSKEKNSSTKNRKGCHFLLSIYYYITFLSLS